MAISFGFMQKVDQHAGFLLCAFLSALRRFRSGPVPPPAAPQEIKKVLCMKFWGLGSLVLQRPAVAALKARFPDAEFHMLTLDRNRDLCERMETYKEIHTLDVTGGPIRVAWRILKLLKKLRKLHADIVVDFEFFTRFSAVVTGLSKAPRRAGFQAWEIWRGTLHNVAVPFNRYWHIQENFLTLARALGADERPAPPPLHVRAADEEKAAALLSAKGVRSDERVVLVNVNAGELALERRWPAARFAAFIRALPTRAPVRVVMIGAPSERAYVEEVRLAAGSDGAVNVAGEADIGTLMALMRRAEIMVTNDSGPLHIAVAMGLRTLSFFGPETPVLYGPTGEGHRVMFRNLPCQPCINVHDLKRIRCIFDKPLCVTEITEESALREAVAMLEPEPPSRQGAKTPRRQAGSLEAI